MTRIFDDPHDFAQDALDGFVAANGRYVRGVNGGVVRSSALGTGKVALVIGGGSGHYPAFAGLVGPGLAAGAACGDMFASPSASRAYRVSKAAQRGGGVLLSYGNYAGDVLHFGQAEERLRAEGIDARTVLVTDDVASSDKPEQRRGIAGDLVVYKVAGAAAEAGASIDDVERLARAANSLTFTLGIAFDGCTLPGAEEPLFTVPEGHMSIGLGIHGEPGIEDRPMASATEIAELLVERLLAHRPDGATRVVPIVNGLGSVKYDELFLLFGRIAALLGDAGLEIIEPECGELVTSLDMAGVSLTLFWPDDELEALWSAPASSPAYKKGAIEVGDGTDVSAASEEDSSTVVHEAASAASIAFAGKAVEVINAVSELLVEHEDDLGALDAFAGDGDHGIGMRRGAVAAAAAASEAQAAGDGVGEVLEIAGEEWSDRAGGTSGALWGAAIDAVGRSLATAQSIGAGEVADAAVAGSEAITTLGKAQLGDKTMVDALLPYVDALKKALSAGTPIPEALGVAAEAAKAAAEATAALSPRLGRARPLAEKSIGHPDPGAVSFGLIVETVAKQFGSSI
jgi:dihydroxyacetone kinase